MKKLVKIFILFISIYFIGSLNINALTLNCNGSLLKKGSRGERVKVLQEMLNQKENCGLATDGIFGNNTKSCVMNYQSHNNLKVDGIVGWETCNKLNGTKSSSSNSKSSNKSTAIKTFKRTNTVKGVVIATDTNIRKAPSTSAKKIGKTSIGKVVTILGQEYDWYRIKGANNKIGYIRADLVSKNCIIVDISDQKLIVYTDGVKDWTTNVITGNRGNHDTPIGSYVLRKTNLAKDRVLKGKNDNGTSYSSPVDYWMPFITERGIGFHDASWRKSYQYNTSTYQGSGSHGCVNMQHEAAEKLFNGITRDVNVVVRK